MRKIQIFLILCFIFSFGCGNNSNKNVFDGDGDRVGSFIPPEYGNVGTFMPPEEETESSLKVETDMGYVIELTKQGTHKEIWDNKIYYSTADCTGEAYAGVNQVQNLIDERFVFIIDEEISYIVQPGIKQIEIVSFREGEGECINDISIDDLSEYIYKYRKITNTDVKSSYPPPITIE